jgi:hypothetical protein
MRFKKSRGKKRRPAIRRRTVKVQGVIEKILRQEGWTDRLRIRRIIDDWESIVGKLTAAQSIPVSLSGGILLVEVGHPLYKTQLSAMKIEILTKLQKENENLNTGIELPSKGRKITDIRFRLVTKNISKVKSTGNGTESDSEVSERATKPVPPEIKEQIEAAVSVVNDSELQASLKTLFLTQSSYSETTE